MMIFFSLSVHWVECFFSKGSQFTCCLVSKLSERRPIIPDLVNCVIVSARSTGITSLLFPCQSATEHPGRPALTPGRLMGGGYLPSEYSGQVTRGMASPGQSEMSGHCLGLILGWSTPTIELIINPRG